MTESERQARLAEIEEAQAALILEMSQRQAINRLTDEPAPVWQGKVVGQMSSPEYAAWCDAGKPPLQPKTQPRPAPRPAPRPPSPRLDRAALEAIGRALAVVRAEMRKKFAQSLDDAVGVVAEALAATKAEHQRDLAELISRGDEHERQLAEMARRIDALERSRRGSKIVDMTSLIGRRASG